MVNCKSFWFIHISKVWFFFYVLCRMCRRLLVFIAFQVRQIQGRKALLVIVKNSLQSVLGLSKTIFLTESLNQHYFAFSLIRKCSTSSWTRISWRTHANISPSTWRHTGRPPTPLWPRPLTPCWDATWVPPTSRPTLPPFLGCRYASSAALDIWLMKMPCWRMNPISDISLFASHNSAEPKNATEQPHRRPLNSQWAAQPDDVRRELPQRAGA